MALAARQTLAEGSVAKTDPRLEPGACHKLGFSLLELVLVLAIVAALAGIALPRYANSMERYRADAAARRVQADLELARSRARISSANLAVVFDVAADEYSIPGLADLDKTTETYRVSLREDPYAADLVSAHFNGEANVSFDGFGKPSDGGQVVIQVGSVKKTVSVDAQTGEVRIQ